MRASPGIESVSFKPGELTPGGMLFLKIIFAVGISVSVLLGGYGVITYFLGRQVGAEN